MTKASRPFDFQEVANARALALSVISRSYKTAPEGGGGWYHRLDRGDPGPSATGLGLLAFYLAGEPIEHRDEALRFLSSRQVKSADPLLNGGWPTNTTFGHPVIEATSWVVRSLGTTHLGCTRRTPNLRAAHRWILENESDGGWGSFSGQEPRVWLTCLALRALRVTDPSDAAISRGVRWLRSAESPDGGWGELPGAPATMVHTAIASLTLLELGQGRDDVGRGAALLSQMDPTVLLDPDVHIESYNVRATLQGSERTWHIPLFHSSLPTVLLAGIRAGALPADTVIRATRTILAHQFPNGHWPSAEGEAGGISVWSVWPYIEALTEVQRGEWLVAPRRWASTVGEAVVLESGEKPHSLGSLVFLGAGGRAAAAIRRRLFPLAVVLVVSASLLLLWFGKLSPEQGVGGVLIPIALLVIDRLR